MHCQHNLIDYVDRVKRNTTKICKEESYLSAINLEPQYKIPFMRQLSKASGLRCSMKNGNYALKKFALFQNLAPDSLFYFPNRN
jgi:hypothetical protein